MGIWRFIIQLFLFLFEILHNKDFKWSVEKKRCLFFLSIYISLASYIHTSPRRAAPEYTLKLLEKPLPRCACFPPLQQAEVPMIHWRPTYNILVTSRHKNILKICYNVTYATTSVPNETIIQTLESAGNQKATAKQKTESLHTKEQGLNQLPLTDLCYLAA